MHRMNSQLKAALNRVTQLEACVEQQEDKISHLEAALGIIQLMDSAGSDNMMMDSAGSDNMSDEK